MSNEITAESYQQLTPDQQRGYEFVTITGIFDEHYGVYRQKEPCLSEEEYQTQEVMWDDIILSCRSECPYSDLINHLKSNYKISKI